MARTPVGVRRVLPYVLVGIVVWLATHESGVHATIAGVALGLLTPARPFRSRDVLHHLKSRLEPFSALIIVPLFGLANAGVLLTGGALSTAASSGVAIGIALGLLLGNLWGSSASRS